MISLDKSGNCGIEGWNEHFKKFVRQPLGRIHPRRIFVADFDYELLALRGHGLERAGYEVIACHDTKNIMGLLQWMIARKSDQCPVDLIICDVNLLNNATIEEIVKQQHCHRFPPLILITTFANSGALARTARLKSNSTFDKTYNPQDELAVVRRLAPYPTIRENVGNAMSSVASL